MAENKIQKLFSYKKSLKEFLEQKNIEDAQKFLESHGIKFSEEELKIIVDILNKYEEKEDFLNDKELENIAGGIYCITKTDAEKSHNESNNKAKTDLIASGMFAGAGLCAGIATYLTGNQTAVGAEIELGASAGALSLYKLIKSGKNKYDASWWKRISNSLS